MTTPRIVYTDSLSSRDSLTDRHTMQKNTPHHHSSTKPQEKKDERPPFIRQMHDLPADEPWRYDEGGEEFATRRRISRALGFERIGVHLDTIPPGHRSSLPHAEELEEEMILVVEGTPHAWIDGVLHELGPGDVVVFEPGTGITHTIINSSDADVKVLVIGDHVPENRYIYPLNPERRGKVPDESWWEDWPERAFGEASPEPK